ncbi:ImmA/IrrE family metallo-endopeptidase [endosymbiont of Lamellibrachia barhami]|uniref:ImmA/IrrE family metallo-endopeptidase n=1 Tax=endosymbiont of Lamellibrachia barhami TaxID=205975 RepID=UPI0015A9886C|nr:hypothetical protein [endosymbiont of Lamellibrachia barhami]
MPDYTEKELQTAFEYLKHEDILKYVPVDKLGNKKDALTALCTMLTLDIDELMKSAKELKEGIATIKNFKYYLNQGLGRYGSAKPFENMDAILVSKGIALMKESCSSLSYANPSKAIHTTENKSGTIKISCDIYRCGKFVTLFALCHEAGHAVDYPLRKAFLAMQTAIYPGFTGAGKEYEHFADLFATSFLMFIEKDKTAIQNAATKIFEDANNDGVHPSKSDRSLKVSTHISSY